jgi:hypothetical protein
VAGTDGEMTGFQALAAMASGVHRSGGMGTISGLSSYWQSLLSTSFGSGSTSQTNNTNSTSAISSLTDNQRLSPFAQVLSALQNLQASDPAKYKEVASQIATNLQTAADSATANGDSNAATELSQLASDFEDSSQSGQLPNIEDLAHALQGGPPPHHGPPPAASDAASDSGTTSASSTGDDDTVQSAALKALSQLLSTLQDSSTTGTTGQNPMDIILQTLEDAGVGVTGS